MQPEITWKNDNSNAKVRIAGKIILLIGDSMMGGATGYYLSDSLKAEGASSIIIDFHTSSGLCRPDYFNWNERLQELLLSKNFDIAFVFIGANDNQAIHRYGSGWIGYHSENWYEEYHSRVGNMMDKLLLRADRVFWIGLPKMLNPGFDEGIRVLNEIYSEEAEKRAPVTYISSYELFNEFNRYDILSPTDNYSSLRSDDGCHLTSAGAKLLIKEIFGFITN